MSLIGGRNDLCRSCDHNVIIECAGGCFYPHNTPPCFRQAVESQQQLKAEIAAAVDAFQGDGIWMKDSDIINAFCAKLRQLSAV